MLRIWMCFEVVLDHFWIHGTYTWPNPFAEYGAVAVPIFMIMSFYFTDVDRVSQDNKMIRSRLGRIIMPQIFWAFTYCAVLLILHDINGQTFFPNFILQCFFGHSVNQSMWFQFDLLVMTGLAILYYKYKALRAYLWVKVKPHMPLPCTVTTFLVPLPVYSEVEL